VTHSRRVLLAASITAAALAIGPPPPASASFHLVSVREVYPGSSASPDAEYVELQAWAAGQNFVRGHTVALLDAAGAQLGAVNFAADVAAGDNQITLLAATGAAESQFGVAADAGMPGGTLDPSGGAVCWEALDCVAWGSFHGATASPAGAPADPSGIPDGMALRRSIAPGCPTLLEAADDSNASAADFFAAFPAPRPNSVAPSEHACAAGEPGAASPQQPGAAAGGRSAAGRRPQTRLRRRPGRIVRRRTAVFRFASSRPGSTFLCKLDRRRFRRCRSPFVARRLRPGRHVFRVKARAPGAAADRSPATWRFRVAKRRRR